MSKHTGDIRSRRRHWGRAAIVVLLVLAVVFFPLPVRDLDRARVLVRDAECLRAVRSVFLDFGYSPFYDAAMIAEGNPKYHYLNKTELNVSDLDALGFHKCSTGDLDDVNLADWYAQGNVLLEFTDENPVKADSKRGLRFNVFHGWLGAQGYRVYIYRCLLGTFVGHRIDWTAALSGYRIATEERTECWTGAAIRSSGVVRLTRRGPVNIAVRRAAQEVGRNCALRRFAYKTLAASASV